MLLPINKLRSLESDDARPLRPDAVVDALLDVKHAEKVTQAHLEALEEVGPVDARLVVVHADYDSRPWPVLTYAVESYEFLEIEDIPSKLYRYADDAHGVWFAGMSIHARLHGKGFHDNPQLWEIPSEERTVLARMRTRFGRTLSPSEFIAYPSDIVRSNVR